MVSPGPRVVALRRTLADAGSVAAVLATVVVVCALVTGVVASLPGLQEQALRRALQNLPATDTTATVVASYDATDPVAQDRAARQALEPVVAVAGGTLVRRVRTVAHAETGTDRSWTFTGAVAAPGEGAPAAAPAGRLPSAGADPLEVAAPVGVDVDPGATMTLRSPLDGSRVPVTVVGTWEPAPDAAPAVGPTDPTALLVHEEDLARVVGRATSVQWTAAPSVVRLEPGDLAPLRTAAAGLTSAVEAAAEQTGTAMRLENPLPDVLEARGRELLAQRMLLLVPAVLLLMLGVAAAMLVASALAHNRRADEWLMRSRGADRGQLVAPTLLEAFAVCVVGAVAGPLVAAWVVRIGASGPTLDATAWAAGAVAAAACWVALGLPAVVAALTGDRGEQLSVEKRRRRTLTALLAAGLLMVALGVFAAIRLRGFSTTVAAFSGGTGEIDPLLVAAPALLLLAVVAVLVLALVPVVLRLTEHAVRSRGVVLAVGTRAAARAPGRAVPLALAVALVAGGVTYASVQQASQDAARHARAAYDVGADVRVTAPPASFRAPVPEEREQLAALPGVTDVSAVSRELEHVGDVAVEVLVADLSGPVARDLVASAADPAATLEALGSPVDGEVPVAVTPDLAEQASLDVGRSLELRLGSGSATLRVVALLPVLPTVQEGRSGLLVDRAALDAAAPAVPSEWWLSVAGDVEQVAVRLEQRPDLATRVLTRDRALTRLADDPGTGGAALSDVMAVTAAGSLVLGAVLLVSVVVLRRRERDAQSAALRALGASEREVTMAVATEYTVVTGGGLLAGAVAGLVTAALALRATALGAGGAPLVPAPTVHLPWSTTGVLLAVLLLVPMVALLVLTRFTRRPEAVGSRAEVAR